ncbi:hypothetical protein ACFQ1M_08030 [Sungkyunkwania multivorans]|uniref:Uncharacterized protein n=1 Tax=Sungkyunkwania multivorans TaxID=1173618 RepID=A0ABW3CWK3_9FLAO
MKIFTKRTQSKSESTNQKWLSLLTGSIVAALVAITPFIFYLYEGVPDAKIWETPFFTYDSSYYGSAYMAFWNIMSKFVPLLICSLWFTTCRHWWYHVILIPISMYSFQLFGALNDDIKYVDEVEIYYIIPIMMVIIPLVYWIRIKLFDKYILGIDLEKMEKELKEKGEL